MSCGETEERQIVRLDGTVIVSVLSGHGLTVWLETPGRERIEGPCAGRVRMLPDGPWVVRAYFPDGYPGDTSGWPLEELAQLGEVRPDRALMP